MYIVLLFHSTEELFQTLLIGRIGSVSDVGLEEGKEEMVGWNLMERLKTMREMAKARTRPVVVVCPWKDRWGIISRTLPWQALKI